MNSQLEIDDDDEAGRSFDRCGQIIRCFVMTWPGSLWRYCTFTRSQTCDDGRYYFRIYCTFCRSFLICDFAQRPTERPLQRKTCTGKSWGERCKNNTRTSWVHELSSARWNGSCVRTEKKCKTDCYFSLSLSFPLCVLFLSLSQQPCWLVNQFLPSCQES